MRQEQETRRRAAFAAVHRGRPRIWLPLALLPMWLASADLAEPPTISASSTNTRSPLTEERPAEERRGAYREVTNAADALTRRHRDEVGLETVVNTVDRQQASNASRSRSVMLSNLISPVGGDALSRRPDEAVSRRRAADAEAGRSDKGLRISAGTGADLETSVNLVRVQGPLEVVWDLLLQNRESIVSNGLSVSNTDLTRFDLGLELGVMPKNWDLGFRAAYGVRREGLLALAGSSGEKLKNGDLRLSPRIQWRGKSRAVAFRNDTELGRFSVGEALAACDLVRTASRFEFRASPSEVNYGGVELRHEFTRTANTGALSATQEAAFDRNRLRLVGGWNFEFARDYFFETALGAALCWVDTAPVAATPLPYLRASWKRFPGVRISVGIESYEELPGDGETFLREALLQPTLPSSLDRGVRFWLEGRAQVGDAFSAELKVFGDRALEWNGWQQTSLGLRALRSQGAAWFSGVRASSQVKAGEILSARIVLEGLFPTGTNTMKPGFDMTLSLGAKIPDTGTGFRFGYHATALEMGRAVDGSFFSIPDRNNLDFTFEQELGKTVTLGAGVKNLLDADLRWYPGSAAMGRSFFAALRMEF